MARPELPPRSLLFAPANRLDLVAKLPRSNPDAVVLDLEDAVRPDDKESARGLAQGGVRELVGSAPGTAVFVRINGPQSEHFMADLASLDTAIAGVLVPKLESGDQVARLMGELARLGDDAPAVIGGLETARGVAAAREIARAGVVGVYFGAEDFVADMGGVRTPLNQEVLYARSEVALAARLAGIYALDQVVVDIRDLDRLRRESREARALSYAGKLCIHPAQVPVVNEAFSPSDEDLERSRRLVEAFSAAEGAKRGVIEFEGQMIDRPLVRRAQALLAQRKDR